MIYYDFENIKKKLMLVNAKEGLGCIPGARHTLNKQIYKVLFYNEY
jgi:hypothetical protein